MAMRHCRVQWAMPLAACVALLPIAASASGARHGVDAKHGEMVLLRSVAPRQAYRTAPPGIAVIVDPSPRSDINRMLGTGELSDDEYAALGAGAAPQARPGTSIEQVTHTALGGAMGNLTGRDGVVSGSGMTRTMSVPLGAIGTATRGIGDHVQGALSQFPLIGQPAAGATPPGG